MDLDVDKLTSILKNDERIQFAFLFGSYATGTAHSRSDIDLAIYCNDKLDFYQLQELKDLINKQYPELPEIDIVQLKFANLIICRQVLEFGQLLFSKNDDLLVDFSVKQMSMYIDFKRSRKIIEDHLDQSVLQ